MAAVLGVVAILFHWVVVVIWALIYIPLRSIRGYLSSRSFQPPCDSASLQLEARSHAFRAMVLISVIESNAELRDLVASGLGVIPLHWSIIMVGILAYEAAALLLNLKASYPPSIE